MLEQSGMLRLFWVVMFQHAACATYLGRRGAVPCGRPIAASFNSCNSCTPCKGLSKTLENSHKGAPPHCQPTSSSTQSVLRTPWSLIFLDLDHQQGCKGERANSGEKIGLLLRILNSATINQKSYHALGMHHPYDGKLP